MVEEAIFSGANVTVTPSRFQVPGQTYAMSGITSVKSVTIRPIKGPLVLGILGLVGLYINPAEGGIFYGVAIIAGALAWAFFGTKHVVGLSTASGEAEAFSSRDAKLIQSVVDAINEAIIRRG